MRKLFLLAAMLICVAPLSAQSKKELKAEAKRLQQQIDQYVKDGWQVAPGHLPLGDQLRRSINMQKELDETGNPKYIISEGQSVGSVYDAAKMQAIEVAKMNVVRLMESEMTGFVDNAFSNGQLPLDEAESKANTVSNVSNRFKQKLGRVVPIMECYRVLPNRNKEVLVMIAYNSAQILSSAREAVRSELDRMNERQLQRLEAEQNN